MAADETARHNQDNIHEGNPPTPTVQCMLLNGESSPVVAMTADDLVKVKTAEALERDSVTNRIKPFLWFLAPIVATILHYLLK